jgi:hypothetical protein
MSGRSGGPGLSSRMMFKSMGRWGRRVRWGRYINSLLCIYCLLAFLSITSQDFLRQLYFSTLADKNSPTAYIHWAMQTLKGLLR